MERKTWFRVTTQSEREMISPSFQNIFEQRLVLVHNAKELLRREFFCVVTTRFDKHTRGLCLLFGTIKI